MRDLQQEVEYMQDESENIQSIRESLPDVCTKNSDRCLENDCWNKMTVFPFINSDPFATQVNLVRFYPLNKTLKTVYHF